MSIYSLKESNLTKVNTMHKTMVNFKTANNLKTKKLIW